MYSFPRFTALCALCVANGCSSALALQNPTIANDAAVTVGVSVDHPIGSLIPEFLSFNFDTSQLRRLNLSTDDSNALNTLAQQLTPAHLRVGGTQGDYEVYHVGDYQNASCDHLPYPMKDYRCAELGEADLVSLFTFVKHNGLKLVFGLNDMYGRPTKEKEEKPECRATSCPELDTTNMQALLEWVYAKGFDDQLFGLELGNELNKVLNGSAGARTQGDDFNALSALVDSIWTDQRSRPRPALIGPDTHSYTQKSADGLAWMGEFAHYAEHVLSAFTFHMYIMGSGSAIDTKHLDESFLNPDALDVSGQMVRDIRKVGKGLGLCIGSPSGVVSARREGHT